MWYWKGVIAKYKARINTLKEYISLIPKKYIYLYTIILVIILWSLGNITESRLTRFCIILLVIAVYKLLLKQIQQHIKSKTVNVSDKFLLFLLWIYKYKNPLLLLLLELELKMCYLMYILSKQNIKLKYFNFIYHFTGLNGIKIVLAKFYAILWDCQRYSIVEILFKRLYGMILSVLIFTNLIQWILLILKTISPNYFLLIFWVYVGLLIIGYMKEPLTIRNIYYLRYETNFISLLFFNINIYRELKIIGLINQDLKIVLGLCSKEILNYENYFKYLLLSNTFNAKIIYHKPSYIYITEITNMYINPDHIIYYYFYDKSNKNSNDSKEINVMNLCQYQILKFKLMFYYIWDVEQAFEMQNTLIFLVSNFYWDKYSYYFSYNIKNFNSIYFNKIQNVELNKFWDLIENSIFYEKMHKGFYDTLFEQTPNYIDLTELHRDFFENNILIEEYSKENYGTKEYEEKQRGFLLEFLNNVKKEWALEASSNLENKYVKIFQEMEKVKQQINETFSN